MRPWALALLGLLTGGLLIWVVWGVSHQVSVVWQRACTTFVLLGMWLLLLVMQLIPIPAGWVALLDQRTMVGLGMPGSGYESISIDTYSTGLYFVTACVLMAIFWMTLALVNSRRRIEMLAKVIVFSGLLQALIGVVVMSTGISFHLFFVSVSNTHAHGTYVYHNHFAGYLELTLAVGIGLMIAKLDGRPSESWRKRLHGWLSLLISEKALLRVSLIIMVIGLVASRSRMGNSAFFVGLLFVGLVAVFFAKYSTRHVSDKRENNTLRSTIIFITSLIVLDVVIIGGVVGIEKVVQRIENTNFETQVREAQLNEKGQPILMPRQEESVEQRSRAARYATGIVRDFPLLGTGGGTFHLAFPHYKPSELQGFWDHPHNDYVEFASDVGLLGFLLLALMVLHSIWQSLKLLLRSRDQLARGMAFASLMGVTSLLIHGFVDFNFQNPANAMLFMILLSFPYLLTLAKK